MAPDQGPVLGQLNIVSNDLPKSMAFNRLLGVDAPDGNLCQTASGAHHANGTIAAGDGVVHVDFDSPRFATMWNAGWAGRTDLAGRILLNFFVGSRAAVDALHDKVTGAGHRALQAPWDAFWGARFAIVEDPDGIAVGIMSPISDQHRAPPPAV